MDIVQREPIFPELKKPLVEKVKKTNETNLSDQEKSPDFIQQKKEKHESSEEKKRKRKEINEADDKGKIIDIKA